MRVYVVWYCRCSCHWCTASVIVSKSLDVFNRICMDGNCSNVVWLIIVGDMPIIHNCFTDVVGL